MAAQNHTNPVASFSIGVEVDGAGRINKFALGEIDIALAEQVADSLISLAYATRDTARRAFLANSQDVEAMLDRVGSKH